MKDKFKSYISNLSKEQFFDVIKTIHEFRELDQWKIKKINVGEMVHTYILINKNKKYFIKEVKPHEAQANYFLFLLKLTHLPYTKYPELLKKCILIMPFIKGKMLRKRKIDLRLLEDFIIFQNKMNNKTFFNKNNLFNLNNFSQEYKTFWKNNFLRDWIIAKKNLLFLKKKYPKIKVIVKFLELLDFLNKNKKRIIEDYSKIPFSRQHHDFREDNIIQTRKGQMLVDWGSSYGYGPFLYDYSKFIVHNKKAFNLLMKTSDICKKFSKEQVQIWLYLALIKKMFNMLCWYIPKGHHNIETEHKTRKMLDYEYKTYKFLLN